MDRSSVRTGTRLRAVLRRRSAFLVGAALLLVAGSLTACGSADDGGSGATTTTLPTTTTGGPMSHPTGSDEIVVRVATGGGFIPVELAFSQLPEFSLYGDGRVITQGPMIEIYPQPALPNLQVRTVTEAGIQQILAWAEEDGLLQPTIDWGQPGITDVASTTITIVVDGQTYRHDIYALGMEQGAGGLTEEQQKARAKALDFQMKIGDLTGQLGGEAGPEESYDFEALRILINEVASVEPDDSGIEPQVLDWPLADLGTIGEPGDFGRTAVISGADLETLMPLLQTSNQLTIWKSGEGLYRLSLRPLLPDEVPAG